MSPSWNHTTQPFQVASSARRIRAAFDGAGADCGEMTGCGRAPPGRPWGQLGSRGLPWVRRDAGRSAAAGASLGRCHPGSLLRVSEGPGGRAVAGALLVSQCPGAECPTRGDAWTCGCACTGAPWVAASLFSSEEEVQGAQAAAMKVFLGLHSTDLLAGDPGKGWLLSLAGAVPAVHPGLFQPRLAQGTRSPAWRARSSLPGSGPALLASRPLLLPFPPPRASH